MSYGVNMATHSQNVSGRRAIKYVLGCEKAYRLMAEVDRVRRSLLVVEREMTTDSCLVGTMWTQSLDQQG